jgi:hypothetical protein
MSRDKLNTKCISRCQQRPHLPPRVDCDHGESCDCDECVTYEASCLAQLRELEKELRAQREVCAWCETGIERQHVGYVHFEMCYFKSGGPGVGTVVPRDFHVRCFERIAGNYFGIEKLPEQRATDGQYVNSLAQMLAF